MRPLPRQRRDRLEAAFARLKSRLTNPRLRRAVEACGAGLLLCEIAAILKAMDGETLSSNERRDLQQGAQKLSRHDQRIAQDILRHWRGDRHAADEPCIQRYAAEELAAAGYEYDPELADSGAVYITTDMGFRHANLVNAQDMTRETDQVLGRLLIPMG